MIASKYCRLRRSSASVAVRCGSDGEIRFLFEPGLKHVKEERLVIDAEKGDCLGHNDPRVRVPFRVWHSILKKLFKLSLCACGYPSNIYKNRPCKKLLSGAG